MKACLIYRSGKKEETYLYLPVGKSFSDLPEELQQTFGEPFLVMKLDVHADARLARVTPARVLEALDKDGYFLQLPPKLPVEEEITRKVRAAEKGKS